MCGADRPSQNGAVAIIHRAVSSQNIRLLFRNPTHPSTANTFMSYETGAGYELGARRRFQQPMPDFVLQIHQHGDLNAPNKDEAVVPTSLTTIKGYTAHEVELDRRLGLFVGEKGVVGRMASVLNGKEKLGDGIIGWN